MSDPQMWTALNVAATMAAGIPTGIFAGHLSDKIGRKIIICILRRRQLRAMSVAVAIVRPICPSRSAHGAQRGPKVRFVSSQAVSNQPPTNFDCAQIAVAL